MITELPSLTPKQVIYETKYDFSRVEQEQILQG